RLGRRSSWSTTTTRSRCASSSRRSGRGSSSGSTSRAVRRCGGSSSRGGSDMRLTLSTAAAQDLTIPELLEACRLRGLAGLELVAGHAHGIGPGTDLREIAEARAAAAEAGVVIAAYRAASRNQAMGEGAARLSVALSAPVVVPASEVMDDDAIA